MDIAGLCKGSTTDSDSVCEGSNPSPAAKEVMWKHMASFLCRYGQIPYDRRDGSSVVPTVRTVPLSALLDFGKFS